MAAYFVRGLTGFGSGLFSVPLLALWQPLQLVVPLIMALDLMASFVLGGFNTRQTSWPEIKRLLPFGLIAAAGLLHAHTQLAILLCLAPMAAGLYLGNRVHVGISRERLLQTVGWILVASGAVLLVKVLA
jgi:uncharacterized membrane protein YfcA